MTSIVESVRAEYLRDKVAYPSFTHVRNSGAVSDTMANSRL